MKKFTSGICCLLLFAGSFAQTINQKLQKAFIQFEADSQLKHAISSLYIIDAKTGEVVFDKNSRIGLCPASTQKIITAVTAFELLGKDYQYKTELSYRGKIEKDGILNGDLWLTGAFDPTFGSWRFLNTKENIILSNWKQALIRTGIKQFANVYYSEQAGLGLQSIPDGWIWQDIGNYYGAGSRPLNWKENQFDMLLKSKHDKGLLTVVQDYGDESANFDNEVLSAEKGSGDNAYIYLTPNSKHGFIKGTIPIDRDSFKISGSLSNPPVTFLKKLLDSFILVNKLQNIFYKAAVIEDYKSGAF
ncbi:MAG: D-alanyl-D-alanine carboxypeptidase, partial [Chitinophagaceae bacterium]|nr:D-alanyl-D-alanine carboxypeptidase [Chitinophagaceae bacterium]